MSTVIGSGRRDMSRHSWVQTAPSSFVPESTPHPPPPTPTPPAPAKATTFYSGIKRPKSRRWHREQQRTERCSQIWPGPAPFSCGRTFPHPRVQILPTFSVFWGGRGPPGGGTEDPRPPEDRGASVPAEHKSTGRPVTRAR